MIWFTLALFLVSFVITALLAPKPEFENARADELDPNNFPMASENSPIPLVLGRVRLNAPNTLWYGDFEAVAITEKVKTGLFSSKRVTVGHKYYLGLDMGLALGPGVVLREVYIDETLAWSGDTTGGTETVINISASDLFGGYKNGGGWGSTGKFYSGSFTQNVNTYVEGQVGSGNVPAYNGMAHMVFEHAYIGESASLRKMAFVLECYTNSLGLPDNGTINSGVDMNPAEAIYQIMVDTWRGLGIAVSDIDLVALQTVGQVLWEEQNGVSILVTSESDGARLISEILRQIDGIMYQDPDSGKVTISLIRDDYDIDLIPEFDENDIAVVRSFTRTSWDEVQSQVKVSFPQRDSESEAVAISQDMAVVATLGKLRTTTLSFPFCYDPDTANEIASRERAQRSVPLFRATIEVNRNANTLRPGSPFKFSWADYGIVDLVMRVQRFDLGELTKGKIVIEALQDKFALSDVVFSSPQSSGWVPVTLTPSDIITYRLVQMPRFFTNKLENPITSERVGLLPVAAKPSGVSTTYSVNVQLPGEALADTSDDPKDVIYEGSGLLSIAYPRSNGFVSGKDTTVGISLTSVVGSFNTVTASDVINGYENIILVNNEFMAFETAVDGGSGNWTLTNVYRGLFGSPIEDHSIGARVYSVPTGAFNSGAINIFPDGQTYNHRFLDGAGGVKQSPDEVTPVAYVGASTYHNNKPLRPRNLKLDGIRQYDHMIDTVASRTLSWSRSNPNSVSVFLENSSDQVPPWNEKYDIDVYISGVRNTTLSGSVGVGVTSYVIPFNLTSINNLDAEIRIKAIDNDATKDAVYLAIYPIDLNQIYVPPADPYIANVVLLVGAEGADGSTAVLDESPVGRALTLSGACAIETTGALANTSSLAINQANESTGYCQAAFSADFQFGTGDFTIEGWAKSNFNHATWYHSIIGNFINSNTGSWSVFLTNDASNRLVFVVQGGPALTTTTDLNNNSFHFAISRNGSTLRIFVNGVMELKNTSYGSVNVGGTTAVRVGGNQAGVNDMWRGLLDEIRITKGVGRYNSDSSFTPQPWYSRS
jgi:hypothetical protein